MKTTDRKSLQQAYRDRIDCAGIFSIACPATGDIWVAWSADVAKAQNRHWFTLRLGTHTNRAMQAAWAAQGEAAFAFVIHEQLKDQDLPGQAKRLADARLAHWLGTLKAMPL